MGDLSWTVKPNCQHRQHVPNILKIHHKLLKVSKIIIIIIIITFNYFPLPQWPRHARAAARPDMYYVFILFIMVLLLSLIFNYPPYHNAARSPSAQISRYHNDPGTHTAAWPNIYYIFYLIYYILYYYYYYLISYPYHNAAQRPSAQFSCLTGRVGLRDSGA